MKRLTPARVTLIMLLVVGALIVAYIAKNLLAREAPPPAPQTRNVPMPMSDLEPGTVITEAHLVQGPARIGSFERDTLFTERVIIGRMVKQKLKAAQPIRSSWLYNPGERPPLKVADNMRAVSVIVGDTSDIVDGLIFPGSYVDLHLTPTGQDQRLRGGTTLTLFKGIKLLAMNRSVTSTGVGSAGRNGNTATLELTPQQANILILAENSGQITMSLNPSGPNGAGVTVGSDDRATLEEILSLEPLPEQPKPFVTEQYRGGNHSRLQFLDGVQSNGSRGLPSPPQTRGPIVKNSDPAGDAQEQQDQQDKQLANTEPEPVAVPRRR